MISVVKCIPYNPPMAGPPNTLFFIVGTGRSGTTLLQAMLSCHPRLHIPAETQFFSRFDPGLHFADPLSAADTDAYVARVTADAWWKELNVPEPALRDALVRSRSSRDLFLWLLRALSPGVTKPRLGEKTPHHEKYARRIVELFPDAQFIHVVRDPRDTVASIRKEDWWRDKSVLMTARHCRRVYERMRHIERALGPARSHRVRYESLVADPESVLRAACAFLHEDFDHAMLHHDQREAAGFTAREASWKALTTKPLDATRHGRYRTLLTDREIDSIERAITPALMADLGYEPEPNLNRRPSWLISDAIEITRRKLRV